MSVNVKGNIKRLVVSLMMVILLFSGTFAQEKPASAGPLTIETVILNTDRSIYLPGEEILFTATIVEADRYIISSLSRVLRVELLNSSGTPMTRTKYEIPGGRLSQKIKLPGSLPSGWYQLRAYTNWMRNSRHTNKSAIRIRIVNPSEPGNLVVYDTPDTLIVSIIPAGSGKMVAGINNSCAVRVTDSYGNPQTFTGAILTASNDTVTSISAGKAGWGEVNFVPSASETYHIISTIPNGSVTMSHMPEIVASGDVISLQADAGSIMVRFRRTADAAPGRVRLIVHSLYSWYWYIAGDTRDGEAIFSVPFNSLPAAMVQFTILDDKGTILTSRLFAPTGMVSKGGEIKLIVPGGQPGVTATALYSVDGADSKGNYNLILRKKEPVENSELYIPGLPGWPADYSIPLDDYERNGWMIAHSYESTLVRSFFGDPAGEPLQREISFRELIYRREGEVDFLPETRGLTINGSVTMRGSGEPVGGEIMSLTAFSDNFLFTNSTFLSGRFHFSLPGRRMEDDLILSYTRAPDEDWELTISPDFDTLASTLPSGIITVTKEELEYIRDRSIDIQLAALYNPAAEDTTVVETPRRESNIFFGYPDDVVYVDEFIRLPNMREVIFEVVPSVVARKEDNKWKIRVVYNQPFPKIYQPLILLDGIPLLEYEEFLDLPPERIRKIEIIKTLYVHGNVIFAGIVNFVSVNGDLAGLSLPPESRIISMQMPEPSASIEIKPAENIDPLLPDLAGNLKLVTLMPSGKGAFNFLTPNNTGKYVLIINGFTSTGKWTNISEPFEIRGAYRGK